MGFPLGAAMVSRQEDSTLAITGQIIRPDPGLPASMMPDQAYYGAHSLPPVRLAP
jgi:hypothetical protein